MRKSITILEHKLEIDCLDEDSIYIDEAEKLINTNIKKVKNTTKSTNIEKIIIMSSLSLLVDKIKEIEKTGESLIKKYDNKITELNCILEKALH